MNLKELTKGIEFETVQGDLDVSIDSITIDSRNVSKNSLFVCISGFNTNGHNYINMAADNGASAVLCQEEVSNLPPNITVLRVSDTRKSLCFIADEFFGKPTERFNLIGITGTNGKTSSAYFMEAILNENGCKTGVIGTVETRVLGKKLDIEFATSTTPDTVELNMIFDKMLEVGTDTVVMEVSSHALELEKVEACKFDICIFTNLTQDHLDLHGNMENYCKAKAKLFKMCKHGVFNADDRYFNEIIKDAECDILTFSIENESDLRAYNIEYLMDGVKFSLDINGKKENFKLNVPGKFSVYNILGVIGAALKAGIDIEIIKKGVEAIKGVPGRIQSLRNSKGFNVFVDYAHTPDGVENIIKAVREFTKGRVIIVFGCGGDRDRKKRPIMGEISAKLADYVIITSDNPRSENPKDILLDIEKGVKPFTKNYEMLEDRRKAIYKAVELAEQGDSVIIAGKGHENYEIFADRTIHFDDLEVAEEALKEIYKD